MGVRRLKCLSFWERALTILSIGVRWELPLVGRAKFLAVDWLYDEHMTQAGQSSLSEGGQSGMGADRPKAMKAGICQVEKQRGE